MVRPSQVRHLPRNNMLPHRCRPLRRMRGRHQPLGMPRRLLPRSALDLCVRVVRHQPQHNLCQRAGCSSSSISRGCVADRVLPDGVCWPGRPGHVATSATTNWFTTSSTSSSAARAAAAAAAARQPGRCTPAGTATCTTTTWFAAAATGRRQPRAGFVDRGTSVGGAE